MIFVDLPLARRLEHAEAVAASRYVESRSRLSPARGARWIQVAGAYALFDGPASPVTQTFGLGLLAEPTLTDLDTLEAFFHQRGAPVNHEVSPLAGLPLAAQLSHRGYHPIEFTSVMYMPLPNPAEHAAAIPSTPANSRLTTRLMAEGEQELWSGISARGWGAHPEWADFLRDSGRVMAATEGLLGFFALLDADPIACGVLWCNAGIALFGGACTVPEARNQGAQQALLHARLNLAATRGCDLAMMCAQPGSASQRNAQRQGFRIAYTRIKWQLAPKA